MLQDIPEDYKVKLSEARQISSSDIQPYRFVAVCDTSCYV